MSYKTVCFLGWPFPNLKIPLVDPTVTSLSVNYCWNSLHPLVFCHANPFPPHHLILFLSLSYQVDTFYFLSILVISQRFLILLHYIALKYYYIITTMACSSSSFLFLCQYQHQQNLPISGNSSLSLPSRPFFSKTHGRFYPWTSWFWEDGIRVPHLMLFFHALILFILIFFSFIVFWFRIKVGYSSLSVVCIVLHLELLIRVILLMQTFVIRIIEVKFQFRLKNNPKNT